MNRDYSLDIAKIIAMFFVAWNHFVGTGTYAFNRISLVINDGTSLPLLPDTSHSLWKIGKFFSSLCDIQFGVVGVIIFFIISGMFIPVMQEKYANDKNSKFYLFIHCFSRVFPTLLITSIVIALVERYLQGIEFSVWEILATSTGAPALFHVRPVTGVIWFLTVLEFAWLFSCLIQKYTLKNVFGLYMICLLLTILPNCVSGNGYLKMLSYNSRMVGIILIGVIWHLVKNYRLIDKLIYLSLAVIISVTILGIYEKTYKLIETYDNVYSYIAALSIILVSKGFFLLINKIPYQEFKNNFIGGIKTISKLFLPFYLSHVCIGLNTIFYLKKYGINSYLCVLLAFVISIITGGGYLLSN